MATVNAARLTQMRAQRTASLEHVCRITPKVKPGAVSTPFETACTVKLSSRSIGGGFGVLVGSGGGSAPMDRPDDAAISLPWGTAVKPNDRIDWIDGGQAYTVGQRRRAKSFDFDVTVQGVEVPS
jgi:hypothetical protein